jgi:hypothetical protein
MLVMSEIRSEKVEVSVTLTARQALSFAQLLKRLDHRELQGLSTTGSEAQYMYEACYEVRKALGKAGFWPK